MYGEERSSLKKRRFLQGLTDHSVVKVKREGNEEIGQWIGCLSFMYPSKVLSSASHMVPCTPPGVIPESH